MALYHGYGTIEKEYKTIKQINQTNMETEYDTDFNPERYANKLILCDGAILAILSAVALGIYLASL